MVSGWYVFSHQFSRTVASPSARLVYSTISLFFPRTSFTFSAFSDAAARSSPVTSRATLSLTVTFSCPRPAAANVYSPRTRSVMLPVQVALNGPAGTNGVGEAPAGTWSVTRRARRASVASPDVNVSINAGSSFSDVDAVVGGTGATAAGCDGACAPDATSSAAKTTAAPRGGRRTRRDMQLLPRRRGCGAISLRDLVDRVVDRVLDRRTVGGLELHRDLHLHDRHEVGDLQRERLAVGAERDRLDVDRVVLLEARVGHRHLGRAVLLRPDVVPLLDRVVFDVLRRGRIERRCERDR